MAFLRRSDDNRAVLGVSLAVTGSKRDTLGVLIIGVNDDGPAAKAGLEEGNRIAGINGVNLKVDRADAGDSYVSSARYQRLQREMQKVKPGDDVTLEIYSDGRFKTMHLKASRASELEGNSRTMIFNGGQGRAAAGDQPRFHRAGSPRQRATRDGPGAPFAAGSARVAAGVAGWTTGRRPRDPVRAACASRGAAHRPPG